MVDDPSGFQYGIAEYIFSGIVQGCNIGLSRDNGKEHGNAGPNAILLHTTISSE